MTALRTWIIAGVLSALWWGYQASKASGVPKQIATGYAVLIMLALGYSIYVYNHRRPGSY